MKKFTLLMVALVASMFGMFGGGGGGAKGGSAGDIKKALKAGKASKLNINKEGVLRKGVGTGDTLVHGNKKKTVGKGFGAPKATKKEAAKARKIGPREMRTTPKRKRK